MFYRIVIFCILIISPVFAIAKNIPSDTINCNLHVDHVVKLNKDGSISIPVKDENDDMGDIVPISLKLFHDKNNNWKAIDNNNVNWEMSFNGRVIRFNSIIKKSGFDTIFIYGATKYTDKLFATEHRNIGIKIHKNYLEYSEELIGFCNSHRN